MLELIFTVLLIYVFWKILKFAIKAAWGLSKIIVTVVFLPLVLIGLVLKGLVAIALPVLLVICIIMMVVLRD